MCHIIIIEKGNEKPKKQTTMKEDAGKLLQDIGKLIFGSMFLVGEIVCI